MRRASMQAAAGAVELAPDRAFEGFRSDDGLRPELRATVLLVVAPLGWLLWAGLFYTVRALLL